MWEVEVIGLCDLWPWPLTLRTKTEYSARVCVSLGHSLLLFSYRQGVKIPGVKTKIKNKLEWLRVGVVLNWKSLVKEDWIEPLNQDIDSLVIIVLLYVLEVHVRR